MQITMAETILAAVTLNENSVGGNIPVFFVSDDNEQTKIANTLANILKGMVHDLENGTYIIVKH